MTLTTGSSVEIAAYLQGEAVEVVARGAAPGPFGEGPEPVPLATMSTRRHVLYAVEDDLETARIRLEHLGERGYCDTLEELINEIHGQVAEEEA